MRKKMQGIKTNDVGWRGKTNFVEVYDVERELDRETTGGKREIKHKETKSKSVRW